MMREPSHRKLERQDMYRDLTKGSIIRGLLLFALPMIAGNLLQQLYNVADTIIVGQYVGADALAAVGSSFTLMVFLTSVILGLCMGSGIVFSILFGAENYNLLRSSVYVSFVFIAAVSLVINISVLYFIDDILVLLKIPESIYAPTRRYLQIIFWGMSFTFIYNYLAALLRALGNSAVPLWFLGGATVINIALDFWFILGCGLGVEGAAWATVAAQLFSSLGLAWYCWRCLPLLRLEKRHRYFKSSIFKMIIEYSLLTCVQQSIMNLGILAVQGLINSFGVTVMAAFAAAVKIDAFAYMPVQDFGNAFSTYVAQNYGAGQSERIRKGIRSAGLTSALFCIFISVMVCLFASPLMGIFIDVSQVDIIAAGVHYLRIEGACYIGIGILFLLYGYYRAVNQPGMSVVLTIASLGTRVALAYLLSATPLGVTGIWLSVPIGWALADAIGIGYYLVRYKKVTQ